MDYIAALATFLIGAALGSCAIFIIAGLARDHAWNWRVTVICAILLAASAMFLGTSVALLVSGPRLLPPGAM